MRKDLKTSIADYSTKYVNNQSYNPVLRSGSPVNKKLAKIKDISSETNLRENKSFNNFISTEFPPH